MYTIDSENEARTLRIDNAEDLMDREWNIIRDARSCFPRKICFHQNPTTQVSTVYNNAEILAYNGELPAPKCNPNTLAYRATATRGSRDKNNYDKPLLYTGYPQKRCPVKCAKTNRLNPERLYADERQ